MMAEKPIIAVLGNHNSGKTSVIETVISRLRKEGYNVASAKHVFIEGFSLDTENSDTYRHSKAGANPVLAVSDVETAVLIKNGMSNFTLKKTHFWTSETDVLIFEGFSNILSENEDVAKIICIKNMDEHEEYNVKMKGEVLAFCSFKQLGTNIVGIKEDSSIIEERVLRFVEKFYHKDKDL